MRQVVGNTHTHTHDLPSVHSVYAHHAKNTYDNFQSAQFLIKHNCVIIAAIFNNFQPFREEDISYMRRVSCTD